MTAIAHRATHQPLILQLLQRKRLLDDDKITKAREAQTRDVRPLDDILVGMGLVNEWDIAGAYAEHLELPLHRLPERGAVPDRSLARWLPEKLCRDQLMVPIAEFPDALEVAFARPHEMLILDEIQVLTGLTVRPVIAPVSVVEALINSLYHGSSFTSAEIRPGVQDFLEVGDDGEHAAESEDEPEIVHLDQPIPPGRDGRVIRLTNQILEEAFRNGASDIHLEPSQDGCSVRLRIDGMLQEITPPSQSLFIPIVSRLKILAKMDIAEKRIPQDGALTLKTSDDKRLDLRVNTMPTVHGEKVVIRVLDKSNIPLELAGLGLDERQTRDLRECIEMPHGLVLVTGPTGSGKSTTLYTCLNRLNTPDSNICTVEDPVEYRFKGMNQVHVRTQTGLTFANALRAFLRQDPDIIMVGEVRDRETAEICLRAALTGHLVLSTLHTNDAASAVSRLEDMGIEPFLLASTLRLVQAQRLIRRLCARCREHYECDEQTSEMYGFSTGQALYRPKGCDHCRGTGYRGRVGIFEVVRITNRLATLIQSRAPVPEMRRTAREQGMKSLADSALDRAREGTTSLEEALSVTISEDQ